jgi:hypothetical protein
VVNIVQRAPDALVRRLAPEVAPAGIRVNILTGGPAYGSWLNQAEIEIGIFSRQCPGKGRIRGPNTLRQETRAWNHRINRTCVKINSKVHTQRRPTEIRLRNLSSGHGPSRTPQPQDTTFSRVDVNMNTHKVRL